MFALNTFLTCALCIVATMSHAQKLKGQITFPDTSVNFTFRMHQHAFKLALVELQHGFWYKEENGRRRKLKTKDEVMKIQFYHEEDTFTLKKVKRSNNLDRKHWRKSWDNLFLLETVEGPNSLFRLYRDVHIGIIPVALSVAFYQKGTENLFTPEDKKFKTALSRYYQDCPELSEKIANGDFGDGEFMEGKQEGLEFDKGPDEEIVKFYNERCF